MRCVERAAMLGAVAIILFVSACGADGPAGGDGDVAIDLGHVGDLSSPQQSLAELFAANLAEFDPEIDVVIHDSGTLGSESELQGAVINGSVDMAIAGSFSHYAPWAGVLETPMLFTSNDEFRDFSTGPTGQDLLSDLGEELDMIPLFIAPHEGPRFITTADRPITEPEDMAGLTLRNPEVPSFTVMAEAVDARPLSLDFSELYLALDRGMVDGQHNPLSHVTGQSFHEVQDYLSMVPWGISPHIVSMSQDTWDDLTDEQQESVRLASDKTAQEYFEVAEKESKERLSFLDDKMQIIVAQDIDVDAFSEVFRSEGVLALSDKYDDRAIQLVESILATR